MQHTDSEDNTSLSSNDDFSSNNSQVSKLFLKEKNVLIDYLKEFCGLQKYLKMIFNEYSMFSQCMAKVIVV